MISKINWKKVQITSIKVLFIAILNTALWVYLIGSMVPYATFGEFKLSWIDYLKLSDKVAFYHIWLLYIGIAIGIILTLFFIKWWIEASKKEKDKQERYRAFSGAMYRWALSAQDRRQLITAIYLYIYTERKAT